jgi:hypothetical protein
VSGLAHAGALPDAAQALPLKLHVTLAVVVVVVVVELDEEGVVGDEPPPPHPKAASVKPDQTMIFETRDMGASPDKS